MATLLPGRASRRPGYTKPAYVIQHRRGRLVAQSWPRKRGLPKQRYMLAILQRMKIAAKAVKRWPTREVEPMRQGLDDFLRENRGVRGTAAIRFRDLQTSILSGRQWEVNFPDGSVSRTAQQVQDASDVLDNLEPRIGSLVTRAPDGWLPTEQCAPKHVLCSYHSQADPNACPPASIPDRSTAAGGF